MRLAIGSLALLAASVSGAYPEGAPWGAANPDADEHCASCHWEVEPQTDSAALAVSGLPERPEPGGRYELVISFDNAGSATGFQMLAWTDGASAGRFSTDATNTEALGAAVRSTAIVEQSGAVRWTVAWHAPDGIETPIVLHVAASAANHDQSPFGDVIHYRTYTIPAP